MFSGNSLDGIVNFTVCNPLLFFVTVTLMFFKFTSSFPSVADGTFPSYI